MAGYLRGTVKIEDGHVKIQYGTKPCTVCPANEEAMDRFGNPTGKTWAQHVEEGGVILVDGPTGRLYTL